MKLSFRIAHFHGNVETARADVGTGMREEIHKLKTHKARGA